MSQTCDISKESRQPAVNALAVEKNETIEKAMAFSTASLPMEVRVDNIDGSIKVAETAINEARFIVHKTIRAESDQRRRSGISLQELQREHLHQEAKITEGRDCAFGREPSPTRVDF